MHQILKNKKTFTKINHKVITSKTTPTHPNHTEQILTQEEMNIENLKTIMSEKKTRLPSLRNQKLENS